MVGTNSSIFNFKSASSVQGWRRFRPIVLATALFLLTQWISLAISDITQEGSKQVVKEKRRWARTKGKFINTAEKLDIVVFGNSATAAGFIPEVFDEQNDGKTQSTNLALVGLQLAPHYFLLKDFLKYNDPPDWILLQYSTGGFEIESFPSFCVQAASPFEVVQYAWLRKNIDVILNYLIPSRLHWPEVLRYFTGKILLACPAKIKKLHKSIYLNQPDANQIYGRSRENFYESQFLDPERYHQAILRNLAKNRGYYYIAEQAAAAGVISTEYLQSKDQSAGQEFAPNEELQPISAKPPAYVKEFFELAQKHHIQIMLIPTYELDRTEQQASHFRPRTQVIKDLKKLQRIYPQLSLAMEERGTILMDYRYFADPGHLNPRGAQLYTTMVAKEFQKLTGLSETTHQFVHAYQEIGTVRTSPANAVNPK